MMTKPVDLNLPQDTVESLRKATPDSPAATSFDLGWEGIQAVRFGQYDNAAHGVQIPPLSQDWLALITQPADEVNLRYNGVRRDSPPPAGSIFVLPAGNAVEWAWKGRMTSFHVFLEPEHISRVATETFGLEPARAMLPPLDGLNAPEVRSVMLAVNAELTRRGVGGSLLIESLANILVIQLVRHMAGQHRLPSRRTSTLPRRKFNSVVEYIMENLENSPTLEAMAAVAHLSPYHFARQFKMTTGLPPHQYVNARRVERAQHILRKEADPCMAEVAQRVGFSDQSQLAFHFKRIVGVTPGQFRIGARIA